MTFVGWVGVQSHVYKAYSRGLRTQPWGDPMLSDSGRERWESDWLRPVGEECSITFLVFPYHGLVKMAHYYSRIPDKEEITFTTSSDQSSCTFSFIAAGGIRDWKLKQCQCFPHKHYRVSLHACHWRNIHAFYAQTTGSFCVSKLYTSSFQTLQKRH